MFGVAATAKVPNVNVDIINAAINFFMFFGLNKLMD